MSGKPTISLISTNTMNNIMGSAGSLVEYEIYSDTYHFENWKDWVLDSSNKPTQTEKDNASKFENYVLKFRCELAKQYNACGLRHPTHGAFMLGSDTADGSITAPSDTTTVVSNTYAMKASEITAWIGTAVILSNTSYLVPNTSVADPYFQFFYCGGSRDHNYTCYKYQPKSSSDGNPRFDPDVSNAQGVYWIQGGSAPSTATVKFKDALFGVKSATALISASLVAMAFF